MRGGDKKRIKTHTDGLKINRHALSKLSLSILQH